MLLDVCGMVEKVAAAGASESSTSLCDPRCVTMALLSSPLRQTSTLSLHVLHVKAPSGGKCDELQMRNPRPRLSLACHCLLLS